MKGKTYTVELTAIELEAAFIACSNYTPRQGGWKQAAQGRAVSKINRVLKQSFRENKS